MKQIQAAEFLEKQIEVINQYENLLSTREIAVVHFPLF
jgi:hypothetical protein